MALGKHMQVMGFVSQPSCQQCRDILGTAESILSSELISISGVLSQDTALKYCRWGISDTGGYNRDLGR